MGVIGDFQTVSKDLIKAGPGINAAARKEIRQVVGALGDELETALDVTIIYLRTGAATFRANDLGRHLADAPEKLLGYYKEFKVCDGLYGLRDEFKQVFSAKRLAVSIKNFFHLPKLVSDLAQGERSILDDLRLMVKQLARYSVKLRARNVDPRSRKSSVGAVHVELRKMINELEKRKTDLRTSVRSLTDNF